MSSPGLSASAGGFPKPARGTRLVAVARQFKFLEDTTFATDRSPRSPLWITLHVGVALMLAFSAMLMAQNVASAPTHQSQVRPTLELPIRFAASPPSRDLAGPAQGTPIHASQAQHIRPPSSIYNVGLDFLGIGEGFPSYTVTAPSPSANIAVGDTEIVQWVNDSYADFDKTTGAIIPLNGQDSTPGNTIWQDLLRGTACADNNDGSTTVQWDVAAHRWVMVQNVLVSPYAVCIAVSQTATFSDNLWFAYQFPAPGNGFPDYQKFAIWSTGWFQTINNFGPAGNMFAGAVACAYNSAKLLVGDPSAEQICIQLTNQDFSLLPADIDSPTAPPAGEDEFFIGGVGAVDNSHLSLYSMHIIDFPSGQATFTGMGNSQLLSIAAFTPACNPNYMGDCVPQAGVPNELQSLGDRLMYRFAYFSDPGSFSPVPVTDLSVFQQGTYAPDGNSRWMGSIAGNGGEILLGYSLSGLEQFPSMAVAGRVATDPPGTLEPESIIVSGTGAQTASPWGTYSSMRIDPSDLRSHTFWYTTEYYQTTAMMDWSTQIASVMFTGGGGGLIPTQHWYVNFDVGNSDGSVGIRWMELTPLPLVPTQTTVTSMPNPSNLGQPVTLTATVTTSDGPASGQVLFQSNGGTIPECPNPVMTVNGVAACTTTSLACGADTILASFHDPQGVYADSSAMLTQTVQSCAGGDFEILPITPASLTVTQSYSNTTEPFFSNTVQVMVQALNGYSGTVTLSCSLNPPIAGGSCVVSGTNPGTIQAMPPHPPPPSFTAMLTVSAAPGTPIGNYMVMVTGQDQTGLMHQASQNLTVIQNGPGVSMPPGGGGPPIVVNFPGPPPNPITPSCTLVNGTGLNGNQPLSMIGGVCTFSPPTGTGPFMLVISGCEVARLRTHMPIYASFFLGLPGFVLLGSLAGGRSRRRRPLQIVGLFMLAAAMLWAVGCGGYGQLTPTGHYQVLVQGTEQDGTVYSAVVPVTVTPLN